MLFVLALVAAPNDLQAVENAYAEAEFEQVAVLVPKQEGRPLTVQQRKRLYELGAFAEFFLGHEKQSAGYFQALFKLDPHTTVDERKYPPKAAAFYRQQRDKAPRAGTVTQPPPKPAHGSGFKPVSLIPFGIGHLILGDIPAGVVFLVLPAALVATSFALYYVRQGERLPGDQYANKPRADAMQITQDVAAFAAIAVSIYGVIDCILFAQGRAAKQQRVSVAPYGAGLSFGLNY